MLQRLEIHNYILIDHLQMNLSQHLTVMTGETGAGKSIIMGALGLILGDRAESNVCKASDTKCIIEGTFILSDINQYASFFEENDIDLTKECIIRREINPQGKSRAFINDTPVTLNILRSFTSKLVDLHQQFDTLDLGESDFQRQVIDALANTDEDLIQYRAIYFDWKNNLRSLDQLLQQKEHFEQTASYKKHQYEELSALNLKENELEQLERDLRVLENAVTIQAELSAATNALESGEQPITSQLKQVIHQLDTIKKYQPDFLPIIERLQAAYIEIADLSNEINRWQDKVDLNNEKLEIIQERLSLGYTLQKKHKVQSTDELLAIQEQLSKDLESVLHIDDTIEQLSATIKEQELKANQLASVISDKRKKEGKPLTQHVNGLLHKVGMPNARIKVQLEKTSLNEWGHDQIDFLFDANNTEKFEPIKKVASGGELSRLMLSIKSLVAQSIDLPTMIFDEIDTGISGEPAKQVGLLLQQLGKNKQIICITHQAQIAAKGNEHLYVFKTQTDQGIHTDIKPLSKEERITHIAQMIGGDPPSKSALESAKELLQ
jgi:DNA repair protein RecN (Recombination protein N)